MGFLEWLGFGGASDAAPGAGGGAAGANAAETETVRRIVEKLDDLPRERARWIAAFAYVLSRVAHADLDISDEETAEMERIVVEEAGLPEAQAVLVVQIAKTQSLLFGGTENYLVTREFNRMASREEKKRLLHCLFAVSAADESVSSDEARTIRLVADELLLEHGDYIEVRSRFRDRLAVLQDPEQGSDTDRS